MQSLLFLPAVMTFIFVSGTCSLHQALQTAVAHCYAWHGQYLLYGLSVALCISKCSALACDKAAASAAVALSLIVLVRIDGGPAQAAIARFLEVGLGIVVALP
jgi:uncharacterized membrane protein YgaE (UPF0421/DUF939 family)